MRGKLSILLPAALLLSVLTACHSGTVPAGSLDGSQPPPPASFLGPNSGGSGSEDAAGQPLPEAEPPVEYDPDYTLDIALPPVSPGSLELPVRGATGYASVQLPLWEEIPEEVPEEDPEEVPGEDGEPQPGDGSASGSADGSQTGDVPPSGDISQPGDTSQSGGDSPDPSQAGSGSQSGDPSQDGDASQTGETAQSGDTSPIEGASSSGALTPAPPSPFLPDFSGDGEYITDPSQPTVGPDGELIYAPGEEPLPDTPEPDPDIDPFEGALAVLEPGTPFLILEENEEGDWWWVACEEWEGWIENRYCLINLPDVIPSMAYNATNSYSSRFVTLGKNIPNITGHSFYPRGSYNRRLERNEFMMPVLYPMSKQICQAQQAALAQGNTLVLYEGYRPHEVQTKVYKALTSLSRSDPKVKQAVTGSPWNISWFIAGGYSNHQRGFAIDVTLAKVDRAELQDIGGCQVVRVREYREYTMPTPIHELSKASATFTGPVASHSPIAWKSAKLTDTMRANRPAMALQRFCTEAGLTPLASEWWHFNDLETRNSVLDNLSTGGYKISQCLSKAP